MRKMYDTLCYLTIRIDPNDREALKNYAKANGSKVVPFVRKLISDAKPRQQWEVEFLDGRISMVK